MSLEAVFKKAAHWQEGSGGIGRVYAPIANPLIDYFGRNSVGIMTRK